MDIFPSLEDLDITNNLLDDNVQQITYRRKWPSYHWRQYLG